VAHSALGFACPIIGEGKKRGRVAVGYVEKLSRVVVVEEDDAGEGACVAAEDKEKGGVEGRKGVPCKGGALGRDRCVLRAGEILPWRVGGVEGGGEG
jgi:hypothetical protein